MGAFCSADIPSSEHGHSQVICPFEDAVKKGGQDGYQIFRPPQKISGFEINSAGALGFNDPVGLAEKDGDELDVFIGPDHKSKIIFVVNQKKLNGSFDEHKILFGFSTYADASKGYLSNYEKDWEKKGLLSSIVMTDINGLRNWIKKGITKKPFEI